MVNPWVLNTIINSIYLCWGWWTVTLGGGNQVTLPISYIDTTYTIVYGGQSSTGYGCFITTQDGTKTVNSFTAWAYTPGWSSGTDYGTYITIGC